MRELQNSDLGPNPRFLNRIRILRKSPTLIRVCQFAQKPALLKKHRIWPPKRVLQLPQLKSYLVAAILLGFAHVPLRTEEILPIVENKWHISYLAQAQEWDASIDLYRQYATELGRHDFEVLQQIAVIVLEQGMKSNDPEMQVMSIYGTTLGGIAAPMDCLESGITSSHPQTQMAAIQALGHLQDDRTEELLKKAMASDYFFARMEAAQQMAIRKSPAAVGQIESLMYRVPPPVRCFFPPFFALVGTSDAISVLKHLMNESFPLTRIEAILSAGRFGRDDLLPFIRKKATHGTIGEQEACASAFASLHDLSALPRLKILAKSPTPHVRLSALIALHAFGEGATDIQEMAQEGDLHAICALSQIPGSEDLLYTLTKHTNIQVRFNATFALLMRRDTRCTQPLLEFLLRDSSDLGFQPHPSVGRSLLAWKVIPSASQHQKKESYDLCTLSLNVREYLLHLSLELPEASFVQIASAIFAHQQRELIPSLVYCLENRRTPASTQLLKRYAHQAGAPLIRTYCLLALVRIQDPAYQEKDLIPWIEAHHKTEMIQFRPTLPWDVRIHEQQNAFELTPEEDARLLILCYQTLADRHSAQSIDLILEGLKSGHVKNRPVLAGLLIYALQ